MNRKVIILKNGEELDNFEIGPFNRAFLFGESVFTSITSNNRSISFFDDHVARLFEGAKHLYRSKFSKTYDEFYEDIYRGIFKIFKKHENVDFNFRVTIYYESTKRELVLSNNNENILITATIKSDEVINHPINFEVKTVEHDMRIWPVNVKIGAYSDRGYDLSVATEEGYQDILYVRQGQVLEGSTSNVFFLNDALEFVTPPLQMGVLNGVTRKNFLKYLTESKISYIERDVLKDEIGFFCGGFLTSAIRGLVAIDAIDDNRYTYTEINDKLTFIERGFQEYSKKFSKTFMEK